MKRSVTLAVPLCLAAVFTIAIQGLSLAEFLPVPVALLAGAGWAIAIGFVAVLIRRRATLSAWVEDTLVALGGMAMALFAFGGAIGIMLMNAALDSSSITGETMMQMFLPSIPIAIAANVPTELFIIPALLILGWRRGIRRVLIVVAAGLYFIHRIWTYLVFASDRLDFAGAERSTNPMSPAERERFADGLHLDDPRWILNFLIFAVFLLAAFLSRVRELAAPVDLATQRG
jgi:hypothetical protein